MEDTSDTHTGFHLMLEAEQLLSDRRIPEAIAIFKQVELIGTFPDRCDSGLWFASMLLGEFERAWEMSDRIRARSISGSHGLWNGKPIANKRVIVRCLHGFGDTVQNMQYAVALRSLAHHVTWQVPPELVQLAPCFEGVDDVITWSEKEPSPAGNWDLQLEVTELPYIFRTRTSQLPVSSGYLRIPSSARTMVRRRLPHRALGLNVGLVWSAGTWDRSRSIPLEHFTSLQSAEGIWYWNLQGGTERDDVRFSSLVLNDMTECHDGILPLAAFVSQLDLVITVDTLAAHLAGALGVPVWLMLKRAADWRWMVDRSDSPWYPSMRLFRQQHPGEWHPVVQEVSSALRKLTDSRKRLRIA